MVTVVDSCSVEENPPQRKWSLFCKEGGGNPAPLFGTLAQLVERSPRVGLIRWFESSKCLAVACLLRKRRVLEQRVRSPCALRVRVKVPSARR